MTVPSTPVTDWNNSFCDSFDARDWARAFVAAVRQYPEIPLDEATMIGWFANALMRGWDERGKRAGLDKLDAALDDIPAEHTANPEEAFQGWGIGIIREAGRRDELAEERASQYVREDGTPK